mmetsp:Transcript_5272/g.8102  ORF Transcript_5272/g.8102 Transcript_5272/m.8102 type:complete len:159 (+) Transcript_5272:391-867(+)|eukprot:CAMPEP_0203795786 /NCGR_PEP_ID=MMETSP0100_2-20121128/7465_1 /ASSEMBLY_ACC=CAM_ASM_000210 /TAXON_ID=96639 /ORGANISM=" , Strain NY0313808BC1" /LENGTH=158 /DNA_ID=CAMNT_0050700417 /DNA_START=373 /DNA_END=849 /DNA_ORIENTATION=-
MMKTPQSPSVRVRKRFDSSGSHGSNGTALLPRSGWADDSDRGEIDASRKPSLEYTEGDGSGVRILSPKKRKNTAPFPESISEKHRHISFKKYSTKWSSGNINYRTSYTTYMLVDDDVFCEYMAPKQPQTTYTFYLVDNLEQEGNRKPTTFKQYYTVDN